MSANDAAHHAADDRRTADDLALVREILDGSVEAWHHFIERFSRLILSVVNQQLFAEDEDEIHTVYVDILSELYKGKFKEYEGRASLSTWLVLISRGRSLDYVRRKRGRRRLPNGYHRLGATERRVFELCYIEQLPVDAIVATLNWDNEAATTADVLRMIDHIEQTVDGRYLRRVAGDRYARGVGAGTGRELEYVLEMRDAYHENASTDAPDRVFEEKQRTRLRERIGRLLAGMPELDRRIVEMKYDEGRTATDIAAELGLGGHRRVYAVLERVTRRLKASLSGME